jgi:hypothetical protein
VWTVELAGEFAMPGLDPGQEERKQLLLFLLLLW